MFGTEPKQEKIVQQLSFSRAKINDFMAIASYIDTADASNMTPILSQIRIEIIFGQCTMTKTNLIDFVVYAFDTDEPDAEMLINEVNFKKFLSSGSSETIQIIEYENGIRFNDGFNKPLRGKEIFKFSDYPATPKLKAENAVKFDKTLITMLNTAKVFVSTDELRPTFMYIHVKEDLIFSTTLILNYTNKTGKKYTDKVVSLTPKECKLMANFNEVEYYFNDNFSILKCGDVYYGCRMKTDVKDMSDTFLSYNATILKEKYIRIMVSDFYNFCNSTMINIKGVKDCYVNATLEVISDGQLKLEFIDSNTLDNTVVVNAQIKDVPVGYKFAFSQENLCQLLSTLPYETISISPLDNNENQIGLWNDKDVNFIAITSKMQNITADKPQ